MTHGPSALSFRPLDAAELDAFFARSRQEFIDGQVAAGEDRAAVEARADEAHATFFIDGKLDPRHHVGRLAVDTDTTVGYLWVAAEANDPASWYVWDVAVDPDQRGRGYGRAAMILAEEMARAHDATAIALSVATNNTVARSLYDSLGYTQTGQAGSLVRMMKTLKS